MNLHLLKRLWTYAATALSVAAFVPALAQASLKCEEVLTKRYCSDGDPRVVLVQPGNYSKTVGAPIIPGYESACWTWTRTFQCIETDPVYNCDSGTPYNTVKNDCSLVASSVKASATVNGVTYITSADYGYRCAYGAWTTNDELPPNKECVALESTTTDGDYVAAAAPGSAVTAGLTTSLATSQTRDESYVCYSAPQTTCSDTCYQPTYNAATGVTENLEVPCTSEVTNCVPASNQCNGSMSLNGDDTVSTNAALGPDGRCVSSKQEYTCQSGSIPRCLTSENCTFESGVPSNIQSNGFAYSQEQTYTCSNETKSCVEYANVSSCVHVGAWGWDKLSFTGEAAQGLGEVNEALSRLEGIEKGMGQQDPYIFSGTDLRCRYAIGSFINTYIAIVVVIVLAVVTGGAALAAMAAALGTSPAVLAAAIIVSAFASEVDNSKEFGNDCCKDYLISGSDAGFKFGSRCTSDEIKLAVAKRKGLTHYLGEFCSKKSGFPVRSCVQKTRTFCVFDDMLALTVNEQGRAQLDALAAQDATSTKWTAEKRFPLYGADVAIGTKYAGVLNTGRWVQRASETKSQVWSWEYPAYCKSSDTQAAAYAAWTAEVNAAGDTKGTSPDKMSTAEAAAVLKKSFALQEFQECPSTAGMMAFLTCSASDDNCNTARMPPEPSGVTVDNSGTEISEVDPNWRIQQVRSFYTPNGAGVTDVMTTDRSYAAVSYAVNEYVAAKGSCHVDGSCLYAFNITDKTVSGGAGARKQTTEYIRFPLYTSRPSATWAAVTYVPQDGGMPLSSYQADPNRGLANPFTVSSQRFIFHPNYIAGTSPEQLHSAFLMEWATEKTSVINPENDYKPLLVPTLLPPNTPGWYPYGDPSKHGKYFYLSGQCDPNSRWCNYGVTVDLDIKRHPWGDAQTPRCWGFTVEQLAALDFNKMDLSKWINSLDLGGSVELSAEQRDAMTKKAVGTAQTFYSAMVSGEAISKPGSTSQALQLSADTLPKLSNDPYEAYKLEVIVPTNWPQWFTSSPNNNPVSNVMVDWGDGSPRTPATMVSGAHVYTASHDYGRNPAGRYKVTVTLSTGSNGAQTLSSYVSISPHDGAVPKTAPLELNNAGVNAASQDTYTPSTTINGVNQTPSNLQTVSPGTVQQFNTQGPTLNTPSTK